MLTKNDLLVLGFLVERPMHGYEIGQALRAQGIEVWFDISNAAIYYSLNKLHRSGAIAETRAHSGGSDKTIYHVTEQGRAEFLAEIARLLGSTEPNRADTYLGVLMLNRLPQPQAVDLLKSRAASLHEWREKVERRVAEDDYHPLQHAILRHAIETAALDARWLSDLAAQMESGADCDTTFQGLMTLRGDLEDFHLPDLIKLIVSGKHSGTLTVSAGPRTRTMTFDTGRLHCAGSQVSDTPVTEPVRVKADIFELFGWQQGAYVFDQRGCPREGCVLLDLSASALILEGARGLESWDVIQRIVPTSEALFEGVRTSAAPAESGLALTDVEARVLALLDGTRNAATVAQLAGLTEFETGRILYGLYLVGLVQPADPDRGRLRRVFREFAELMCRSAIPYRTSPEEASACEAEVNRRCADLPVSIQDSRIVDETDGNLAAAELAAIYRRFISTQHTVLSERLGHDVAAELRREVLARISPVLREVLEAYSLV